MKQLFKISNSILTVVVFIAAVTFSACDSPAEKVDDAKENVTQAKENLSQAQHDYQTEVANFKNETNQKIIDNDKMIADIKIKIANVKMDTRATCEKQIVSLEQKNVDIKKRLDEYKEDDLEKWQSFKTEFNHDIDELGMALHDFTVDNKK